MIKRFTERANAFFARNQIKILCVCIASVLLFAGTALLSACSGHRHKGTLVSLSTAQGQEIPCCGVFCCAECGETYEKSVTYADVGLPVVNVTGSLEGISKETRVTVTVKIDGPVSFTSAATLKWQGVSSLRNEKKNYNVKLIKPNGKSNPVALRDAWGSQSKYCLKANWQDYAGAHNLGAAKLWGQIVHSRGINDRLDTLVNGGAVDGFPVLLYLNGDFEWIYTLNTPKDRWIFGMQKGQGHEGLLFGEEWSDSVQLQTPIADVNDPLSSGWEVEYCSTEDTAEGIAWLGEGMNALISFLRENDGPALRDGLGRYTDVDRAIDYMLFVLFICGADNTGRNILWATYDGRQYIPSAYDLDNTWIFYENVSNDALPEGWKNGDALRSNLLFDRLLDNYGPEIAARYAELRREILTEENVRRTFAAYPEQIPDLARTAETERWPKEGGIREDLLDLYTEFFAYRTRALDANFGFSENP